MKRTREQDLRVIEAVAKTLAGFVEDVRSRDGTDRRPMLDAQVQMWATDALRALGDDHELTNEVVAAVLDGEAQP